MKSVVKFADLKIKKAFEHLKQSKNEDKKLYDFIYRAINELEKDPFTGLHISKKLMPKLYVKKYNAQNLWKYDLPNGWRLIYTIKRNEILIVSVILEWFNHKNYERRFGYK
ncbi:MAG: type II toxin-antitoxin system YoeB family toxin [Nanoarchaeota archaeon]|nr:type II toxin-antitoxin system YoeB family toxin [Nanoarchaeota archaeon]